MLKNPQKYVSEEIYLIKYKNGFVNPGIKSQIILKSLFFSVRNHTAMKVTLKNVSRRRKPISRNYFECLHRIETPTCNVFSEMSISCTTMSDRF